MPIVSLSLFKEHTRTDDVAGGDATLQQYLSAAEAYCLRYTRRSVAELCDMGCGAMPADIIQAIIMLGAHYVDQREAVTTGQSTPVPFGVHTLLNPYRRLT